jgi:hypothetical protein
MYVTPTNRQYRSSLMRQGVAPRALLATRNKGDIQRAAREWTKSVPPKRTSLRLNLCDANSHIVLKQYRFRLAGGGDFDNHRDSFAQAIDEHLLLDTYYRSVVLTEVTPHGEDMVIFHYTIDGTPYTMEQGRRDIATNNTIGTALLAQLEVHICNGAAGITLDKVSTEAMTRVRCDANKVAILESDVPPRYETQDPLDPREWT